MRNQSRPESNKEPQYEDGSNLRALLHEAAHRELVDIALHAVGLVVDIGRESLELRSRGLEVSKKTDGSTITNADIRASRRFVTGLSRIFPATVISEENISGLDLRHFDPGKPWWLTDPIDATYTYQKGEPHFANMAALLCDGEVHIGIIGAPARDEVFYAIKDVGAFHLDLERGLTSLLRSAVENYQQAKIGVYELPPSEAEFAVRDKLDLAPFAAVEFTKLPSALKMCMVARGEFVASGGSVSHGIWDVAPADPILREAGASLIDFHSGASPQYDPRKPEIHATLAYAEGIRLNSS